MIGDVRAPVKAVLTLNGKIKRTDGGNNEPLGPPAAAAAAAADAMDSFAYPRPDLSSNLGT